jgi:L-malate glycosyltransferase
MKNLELSVFGSFGFGNVGDEIVPYCVKNLGENIGADIKLTTFSRYDGILKSDVINHQSYRNTDLGSLLFISGGGIIENHEMSCLDRALCKPNIHEATKIIPFGISVEPGVQFGWLAKRRLKKNLKRLEKIYVRDKLSSRVLKDLAPNIPQEIIGDLGLWCKSGPLDATRLQLKLPEKYLTVIVSDNWANQQFIDWFADEIATLAKKHGLSVLMLPISLVCSEDISIAQRVSEKIHANDISIEVVSLGKEDIGAIPDGGTIAGIISRGQLTLSMRLHGCVISYAQQVPFIAVAYHPKLLGFLETVGWEHAVVPKEFPQQQSKGSYGYAFSDLNLKQDSISELYPIILQKADFSQLQILKNRQSEILKSILGIA